MNEATTPDELDLDLGEETTSHPDNNPAEAAEAREEETQPDHTSADETAATATPDEDAELSKKIAWAKNKGIPTDDLTPAAIKAIEVAMNGERDFHAGQQAKSQLKEEATTAVEASIADPVLAELQSMKVRLNVSEFFAQHPDAQGMDNEMAEIVRARPHLAGDLDAIYALAKAGKTEAALEEAEKKGRDAAKAEIARSSAAKTPTGNATTSDVEKPDAQLDAFDKEFDSY